MGRSCGEMSAEDIRTRVKDCKSEGRWRIERPKLRWIDCVLENIKKLGVKNWWTVARKPGERSFRKVWVTLGCRADDDDDDSYTSTVL
jgi:hypothetical protein